MGWLWGFNYEGTQWPHNSVFFSSLLARRWHAAHSAAHCRGMFYTPNELCLQKNLIWSAAVIVLSEKERETERRRRRRRGGQRGGGGRGEEACRGWRGRGACNFKNVICTKSKLTPEERLLWCVDTCTGKSGRKERREGGGEKKCLW